MRSLPPIPLNGIPGQVSNERKAVDLPCLHAHPSCRRTDSPARTSVCPGGSSEGRLSQVGAGRPGATGAGEGVDPAGVRGRPGHRMSPSRRIGWNRPLPGSWGRGNWRSRFLMAHRVDAVEDRIRRTGRRGRDGLPAEALRLYGGAYWAAGGGPSPAVRGRGRVPRRLRDAGPGWWTPPPTGGPPGAPGRIPGGRPAEFTFLLYLARTPEAGPLSRAETRPPTFWEDTPQPSPTWIDVYAQFRLRREDRMRRLPTPPLFTTLRGTGYMLDPGGSSGSEGCGFWSPTFRPDPPDPLVHGRRWPSRWWPSRGGFRGSSSPGALLDRTDGLPQPGRTLAVFTGGAGETTARRIPTPGGAGAGDHPHGRLRFPRDLDIVVLDSQGGCGGGQRPPHPTGAGGAGKGRPGPLLFPPRTAGGGGCLAGGYRFRGPVPSLPWNEGHFTRPEGRYRLFVRPLEAGGRRLPAAGGSTPFWKVDDHAGPDPGGFFLVL